MSNKTLATLKEECADQRQSYRGLKKQVEKAPESTSCVEIVLRATQPDQDGDEALETLLADISQPLVISRVRKNQGIWGLQPWDVEDIVQETLIRMSRRLRKRDQPFRVESFSQYIVYLFTTTRSAAMNFLGKRSSTQSEEESLDQPSYSDEDGDKHEHTGRADREVGGYEAKAVVDRVLSRCLPDVLERQIVMLRLAYDEKPDDIVNFLKSEYPEIDKKRVFRVLENAIKKLHRCGEFKALAAENILDAGLQ